MGWFWNSASPPSSSSSTAAAPPTTAPAPPPPAAPTGDREVQKFWAMIQEEGQAPKRTTAPPPPAPQPTPAASPPPTSWLPWAKAPPLETSPTLDPLYNPRRGRTPESLAMSETQLPTTMSCRDAFDYAWHCHTPGAQWNAVYRYGGLRNCSELWDDFWFCMRTKSFSDEARARAIQEHYRAKEQEQYGSGRPSSEDVWESRKERVAPGTAFSVPFGEAKKAGEEGMERLDLERRRREREQWAKQQGGGNGKQQ